MVMARNRNARVSSGHKRLGQKPRGARIFLVWARATLINRQRPPCQIEAKMSAVGDWSGGGGMSA